MLPPYSPKTLKPTTQQRMVNSEPRKTPTTIHTSTIQRRLPFERMISSHKNTPSKYFPPI